MLRGSYKMLRFSMKWVLNKRESAQESGTRYTCLQYFPTLSCKSLLFWLMRNDCKLLTARDDCKRRLLTMLNPHEFLAHLSICDCLQVFASYWAMFRVGTKSQTILHCNPPFRSTWFKKETLTQKQTYMCTDTALLWRGLHIRKSTFSRNRKRGICRNAMCRFN